ncbi:MAG: Gfo/Idh/MocA family oxidoreductase [Gemmatimonadota bacterium]
MSSTAAQSSSPFEPVRVGVVGAGRPNVATQNHLPAIRASGLLRLVAVCDRLPGVEEYGRQYGARVHREYEALLADPEVEMVQVATPDWLHADQAIQALEAGKDVLVQKPLCTSRQELAALRRARQRTGRHLQVAQNTRRRHRPQALCRLLEAGAVGRLVHLEEASVGRRFPLRDAGSPYYTTGVGSVWLHNGMHLLDTAAMLAGAPPVRAWSVANRNPEGAPEYLGVAENLVAAQVDFANGVTGAFTVNTAMMRDDLPRFSRARYIGTEGELYTGSEAEGLTLYRAGEEPRPVELDEPPADEDVADSFRTAFEDFARTMRDGRVREPTYELSAAVMEALFQGLESAAVMGWQG